MSPISQKSPRRSRIRDKRTTDELSSQKYDSSSSAMKGLSWSKRRKSSEALRPSKKSLSQSPAKDESSEKDRLQKVVDDISKKCSKQENQLDEISEILNNKVHLIETLSKEKLELSTSLENLRKELKGLKEEKKELTVKSSASTEKLTEVSNENDKLKHTIEELEYKTSETDTTCELLKKELEDTKKRLQALDFKCSQYEKDLSTNAQTLQNYLEKYKNVVEEKDKLLNEIEELFSTKNELLKSIQEDKDRIQKFENEIAELKERLEEKTQSIISLQSQCEELEAKTNELSKDKEEKEKAKESFTESLSNVNNLFLSNLKDLTYVCKQYLDSEEEKFKDIDDFLSSSLSVTDNDDQIEELLSNIITANAKFEQTIDFLSEQMSSLSSIQQQFKMDNEEIESLKIQNSQLNAHIKTLQLSEKESKSFIKESKSKIDVLEQDLHNANSDIKDLKNLVEAQQMQVEDMQQSLQDKEKSLKQSKIKLSSSEIHLGTVQKQIEKDEHLLNLKDDEIDKLQKRIMNYQAQVDELLTEKIESASQIKIIPNEFSRRSVSTFDPSKDITIVSSASEKSKRPSIQTLKSSSDNAIANQIKVDSDEFIHETASIFNPSKDDTNVANASEKSLRPDVETVKSSSKNDSKIASQIRVNPVEFFHESVSSFDPSKNIANVSEESTTQDIQPARSSSKSSGVIASQTNEFPQGSISAFKPFKDEEYVSASEKFLRPRERSSMEFEQNTVSTFDPLKDQANVSNASEISIGRDVQSVNENVQSLASSHTSIISVKDGEYTKNLDKYIKKIKSLKTKLYVTEKRIEMLEKEKSDLRKQVLSQGQEGIVTSSSPEEVDTLKKDLKDLKDKLQEKTSFIRDLKSDMFRTCNSLIDKQKEVDNLKRKLSDSKELVAEDRSKSEDNLKSRYSDPLQMSTETNIKMLKKQKWEVIQDILSQQKQFYERRNIHLGHLEKFKRHIEKLRALQISPTMFKSESEPFLNSFTAENNCYAEKCDRTLKNLQIELELDVECLQNFKIFLKRFFIPLVLQNCEQCSKHVDNSTSVKASEINIEKSVSSSSKFVHEGENWKKLAAFENQRTSPEDIVQDISQLPSNDRLISTASALAHKIDLIEHTLKSARTLSDNVKFSSVEEVSKKFNAAKSLVVKICNEINTQQVKMDEIFHLNSVLKSLGLFETNAFFSHSKQDISDRESLSEETIPISRSGSLSPMSFEETLPFKTFSGKSDTSKKSDTHYPENEKSSKGSYSELAHKSAIAGGSRDSIFQRSHVSSPDQGIESDPNHESSAPEQAEKEDFRESASRLSKRQESGTKQKQWSGERQISSGSLYSFIDSSSKLKDNSPATGDSLHAIGGLENYELLKKEVQESLVGIKAVLSRTGDGLKHVDKYTSPRKNLEYCTFKAIRDASGNIEVCLIEASKLIDKFWVAPCPTAEELNVLIQQTQELREKLKSLEEAKLKQESYFKDALARLKQKEIQQQNMEKKISKKLVKTKKVIRQAEIKLLERENQEPLIPNYPNDEPTCQKQL